MTSPAQMFVGSVRWAKGAEYAQEFEQITGRDGAVAVHVAHAIGVAWVEAMHVLVAGIGGVVQRFGVGATDRKNKLRRGFLRQHPLTQACKVAAAVGCGGDADEPSGGAIQAVGPHERDFTAARIFGLGSGAFWWPVVTVPNEHFGAVEKGRWCLVAVDEGLACGGSGSLVVFCKEFADNRVVARAVAGDGVARFLEGDVDRIGGRAKTGHRSILTTDLRPKRRFRPARHFRFRAHPEARGIVAGHFYDLLTHHRSGATPNRDQLKPAGAVVPCAVGRCRGQSSPLDVSGRQRTGRKVAREEERFVDGFCE